MRNETGNYHWRIVVLLFFATGLLNSGSTIGAIIELVIVSSIWLFFIFLIPDFLNKTQHINLKELVLPLILIYAVSSLGGISGGWISSQFIKSGKGIDFARKTTILFCAFLVLPVVLVSDILPKKAVGGAFSTTFVRLIQEATKSYFLIFTDYENA